MAEETTNTHTQQIAAEWTKIVNAGLTHFETAVNEIAKVEAKAVAQLIDAFGTATGYARESLATAEKVSAEWRKVALDAARRYAQAVTPKQ